MSILSSIQGHQDLIKLNDAQRAELCAEIREFIVSNVAKTGGHLSSNLGVVELTVAIETVFDTSVDRLVFDVGHQSYIHKLLTGRQGDFEHLRMYGGMSGFPKPYESDTDAFVAGHASSSVSIALGMARARHLTGENYHVLALIGDGATTGGMAYEGFNDAGGSKEPMIVILNDNEMSIDRNVGGLAKYLSRLRTGEKYTDFKKFFRRITQTIPGGNGIYRFTHKTKELLKGTLLPDTMFDYMGMEYLGPVDGHDIHQLIRVLETARDMNKPVLIHVLTQKGRGYKPAEKNPAKFHGIGRFNLETGKLLGERNIGFSDVFGSTMMELAAEDSRVCAITAAMPGGTGLLEYQKKFPKQLFDVGIAEEHAVSMAGGLAKQGARPVVAIYSTFFQRSYDQIMQDIGLLGLHVVLAVDRAGLVGGDGATHHGVFDVGFLRQIPGMTIMCPASLAELDQMLRWAVKEFDGPVAIRYPRGTEGAYKNSAFRGIPGEVCVHRKGSDVTLVSYGTVTNQVTAAAEKLADRGVEASVLRLLSASDLCAENLAEQMAGSTVVVVEETCTGSGIKEALGWELHKIKPGCHVYGIDLGSDFVPHGDMLSLYRRAGLDKDSICDFVCEVLNHEK